MQSHMFTLHNVQQQDNCLNIVRHGIPTQPNERGKNIGSKGKYVCRTNIEHRTRSWFFITIPLLI